MLADWTASYQPPHRYTGGYHGILVDWQINRAIDDGEIGLDPFDPMLIQPNSIDVRLGDEILFDLSDDHIDPEGKDTHAYVSVNANGGLLAPKAFGLASTMEVLTLPDNVVAAVEGKSSLARDGLSIHCTGGWIDAGFSGQITLELFNMNNRAIKLKEGMRIAQIVFFRTESAATPYSQKEDARYHGQMGPTPSKGYRRD